MARSAHFGAANMDICALALTEAVAPVKMRVGGYAEAGWDSACFRRRGKVAWEKKRAPLLWWQMVSIGFFTGFIFVISVRLVHSDPPSFLKVLNLRLEERLPHESARSIVYSSRARSILILLCDGLESGSETLFVGSIC